MALAVQYFFDYQERMCTRVADHLQSIQDQKLPDLESFILELYSSRPQMLATKQDKIKKIRRALSTCNSDVWRSIHQLRRKSSKMRLAWFIIGLLDLLMLVSSTMISNGHIGRFMIFILAGIFALSHLMPVRYAIQTFRACLRLEQIVLRRDKRRSKPNLLGRTAKLVGELVSNKVSRHFAGAYSYVFEVVHKFLLQASWIRHPWLQICGLRSRYGNWLDASERRLNIRQSLDLEPVGLENITAGNAPGSVYYLDGLVNSLLSSIRQEVALRQLPRRDEVTVFTVYKVPTEAGV